MSNNNKTPAIRFKGFTDTWEQRKLGDMVDRVTRKNTNLESELPLTISAQYGLIDQNEFFDKRIASKDVSGYYLLKKGEFAYNKSTSSDAPWGAVKRLDRYENGVLSTLYIVFALKENGNINSDFLVSYYDTDCWHKGIQAIAAEGARNHGLLNITPADYFETTLNVPKNMEEQKQIGRYFQNLDNLITLHQRKCDKLIQFKAAMLKKMFPQNGADKPELRFKGFTDAWEQRKLGELMEITSVKRIHQSDWTDSGVRFLRARDIVAVSKNEEVSEPLFISQEKYDEYSALSGKVKIGDLLVTGVGTIGVPMLINNEEPLYFKDGNIIWFKNEDRIDGEFFYHSFNGSFIQNFIKESAGIGTVGTYTIESGKKTPILLPTQKDEQQKIGTFFSQLDTLITLHQRKCDKYKSIKAGLIRKFFP